MAAATVVVNRQNFWSFFYRYNIFFFFSFSKLLKIKANTSTPLFDDDDVDEEEEDGVNVFLIFKSTLLSCLLNCFFHGVLLRYSVGSIAPVAFDDLRESFGQSSAFSLISLFTTWHSSWNEDCCWCAWCWGWFKNEEAFSPTGATKDSLSVVDSRWIWLI